MVEVFFSMDPFANLYEESIKVDPNIKVHKTYENKENFWNGATNKTADCL